MQDQPVSQQLIAPQSGDVRTQRRVTTIIGGVAALLVVVLLAGLFMGRQAIQNAPGGPPVTAAELYQMNLRSVALVSANEGWAVGGIMPQVAPGQAKAVAPALLHFLDGRWYDVALNDPDHRALMLQSVAMLSAEEGWAVGGTQYVANGAEVDAYIAGYFLRFQHGAWSIAQELPNARLTKIAFDSATDGWAVGDDIVLHYDGQRWAQIQDPALAHVSFAAVAASGPHDVWLAGTRSNAQAGPESAGIEVCFHFDGNSWQSQHLDSTGVRLNDIAVVAPNDAIAVGLLPAGVSPNTTPYGPTPAFNGDTGVVYFFNLNPHQGSQAGSYGDGMLHNQPHTIGYTAMVINDSSEWYIVGGDGFIKHIKSGQNLYYGEVAPILTHHDLYGIALTSANEGWAAGDAGTLLHLGNGKWSLYQP